VPFYYDLRIPEFGPSDRRENLVFEKWIIAEKKMIEAGTALAVVRRCETAYLLRNAGPGLFTPWNVHEGEGVAEEQPFGRITTDGELIPYGRPYVTFEIVASTKL